MINRLERSKVEKPVDLQMEREQRDKEETHKAKMEDVERRANEKIEREERKKADDIKNYVGFMDSSKMTSNQDPVDLDDFM